MLPIEGPAELFFTPGAARAVAADIREARDVEVFFIGRRDETGLIAEVESHAYGTRSQVPAPIQNARPGEVIIHNHPSGELLPSDADIEVAARVGQQGTGSYIVDNACTRCRVIVRPVDPRPVELIPASQVLEKLGPGSALAGVIGAYEDRPQQRDMALAVSRAFNRNGVAVIEAGTGTGKSFAYLIPAILHALRNREKIVVSTNTINLQEQLIHKDIPAVRQALGEEFSAVIVKGRSNYVCKRKAQYAENEMDSLVEERVRDELKQLLDWARTSDTGDRTELPVPPSSEAWERVESEADNCLRVRCPFYEKCFFYNSRRRAARADILVVNHSLLMSDIAVRRESGNWTTAAVLPPYQRVVIDEAHHLEEVATRHLSNEVTRNGLRRIFGRLHRSERGRAAGVLSNVVAVIDGLVSAHALQVNEPLVRDITFDLIPRIATVRETCDHTLAEFGHQFLSAAKLDFPRRPVEHAVRITTALTSKEPWNQQCRPALEDLAAELSEFIDLNRAILQKIDDADKPVRDALTNATLEWKAIIGRLDERRRAVQSFLGEDDSIVRWVELAEDEGGRLIVRLAESPIEVGAALAESLHMNLKSEILTSATLSVDSDFEFFLQRTGVRQTPGLAPTAPDGEAAPWTAVDDEEPPPPPGQKPLETRLLPSPFQYRDQVFLGVPNDIGDPRSAEFERGLSDLVVRSVAVSDGRAFILFTSWGQMNAVHRTAAPLIRKLGYQVFKQGEFSRDQLLRRFREDETSVLFATSSFWEGVDVKGSALELLVIAKLPFAIPTEPIQQAQFEALEAQGLDPFESLVVPRAIIRFKQGFGRLIRARTDRGAVIVADERVVTKAYGRRFLRSIPDCAPLHLPTDDLLKRMTDFYQRHRQPS